ncbi:MAG: [acyl-carrier-protein] S-malonyltransferase [Gammaproteobacteria bacterium]|nr:ACP S-malonyltransferase [Gammaproteobacteria bacterium]PCH62245.1 MAG: [acyl-carrier-protein] S-malonyltransferase [Gammaproteobacteria bacterium]
MSYSFVFPGQGSQSVGMLAELYDQAPIIAATFDEASALLDYDLWQVVNNGPAEELNKTEITQPAILVASVACYRVWLDKGFDAPIAMSGHSLGEYSALVCAGALSFTDAVTLVRDRGCFMQSAVAEGEGSMAAILGLDDDIVIDICVAAADGEILSAANFNSPGQVVIAGASGAVARAADIAKERGAKRALILPVSVPSHCLLMKPAAEQLTQSLANIEINAPAIPVIHNVDGKAHSAPDEIRQALIAQLYTSVRWVDCVAQLATYQADQLIECGPGKVLAGLIRRIDKSLATRNLITVADFVA